MTTPVWITPPGNLGCVELNAYVSKKVTAENAVTYAITSGTLPTGMGFATSSGTFYGVPVLGNYSTSQSIYNFSFTVTATGSDASTSARTFNFSVVGGCGMYLPETAVLSSSIRFGSLLADMPFDCDPWDQSLFDQTDAPISRTDIRYQITVGEVDSGNNIIWRIGQGQIPPNSTFSNLGLLSINTDRAFLPFGREQFIKSDAPNLPSLSEASWFTWLRRYLSQAQQEDYQWTIELSDGVGPILRSHTMRVVYLRIPSSIYFDMSNWDTDLYDQTVAADNWFEINRPYLNIDSNQYYYLIIDSTHEQLSWVTEPNLGIVENGSVSEQAVAATGNRPISYKLKPFSLSRLPQGIMLRADGLISGRYSFKCYEDDPVNLPVNNIYNFSVRASTACDWSFTERSFSLQVRRFNLRPSDILWIRHFSSVAERRELNRLLDDQDMFPDHLIYRITDPWWGKQRYMRFIAAPGVNIRTPATYQTALEYNHYFKTHLFDQLRTAVAVDQDLKVRYEVVYLTIQDDLLGRDPVTGLPKPEPNTIDLRPYIINYYIANGQTYYTLRPNALENMRERIRSFIGYYNPGLVPAWMSSVQPIPGEPGLFTAPIGFMPAIVLAYCRPGGASTIAYNLRNVKFNWFRFEYERYQLENRLSKNYNADTNLWVPAQLTEFDSNTCVFDSGTTSIIENQDSYADPEVGDKYLKFPMVGAIN